MRRRLTAFPLLRHGTATSLRRQTNLPAERLYGHLSTGRTERSARRRYRLSRRHRTHADASVPHSLSRRPDRDCGSCSVVAAPYRDRISSYRRATRRQYTLRKHPYKLVFPKAGRTATPGNGTPHDAPARPCACKGKISRNEKEGNTFFKAPLRVLLRALRET